VVNLGDSLYGPLDPAGTAQRLIDSAIPSIQGNQDRILLAPPAGAHSSATFSFVTAALTEAHREWLASQSATTVLTGEGIDDLFCCHGTPESDEIYLLERVTPEGAVVLNEPTNIAQALRGIPQRIVACGHTHLPRVVQVREGLVVVNPGSVGLPAYTDDLPVPHAIEAGSPHARYAILGFTSERLVGVEQVAVAYPWDQAATTARENGRDDWAYCLETGRTSL